MELCARKDVPVEQTWDLSLIFAEEALMWEELDRTKAAVKSLSETYMGKLTDAGNIVDQYVSFGKERAEDQLQDVVLADHLFLHFIQNLNRILVITHFLPSFLEPKRFSLP